MPHDHVVDEHGEGARSRARRAATPSARSPIAAAVPSTASALTSASTTMARPRQLLAQRAADRLAPPAMSATLPGTDRPYHQGELQSG